MISPAVGRSKLERWRADSPPASPAAPGPVLLPSYRDVVLSSRWPTRFRWCLSCSLRLVSLLSQPAPLPTALSSITAGRYLEDRLKKDGRRWFVADTGEGAVSLPATFGGRFRQTFAVNKRKPHHSVNFVIAHDGLTLYDLVSYNFKHNDANGEGGRDGCNDNFSWNCGVEGETNDLNVLSLRSRQMKNFHVALMISQGTPMMLMGDEYGHTRYGNNNSYGHDTCINHFQWGQLEERRDGHFRFLSEVIKFRHNHPILRRDRFLSKNDVTWHEDWWENQESKFLAFTVHDHNSGGDIYLAFNAHDYFVDAVIPPPPHQKCWNRVVDTNLESPSDIVPEGVPFTGPRYRIAPYSSILLKASP